MSIVVGFLFGTKLLYRCAFGRYSRWGCLTCVSIGATMASYIFAY
ncbi:Protein of unknown function [Anaplasma phagocytophilum]|uniref:Uncharacterized protein n=1 Tax=Anaplasma phagocytophilum TaxID=948 RepID=A0A098EHB9_ANAPH|nr:Protein of unknown function [Anaplasma phagocytophilum]